MKNQTNKNIFGFHPVLVCLLCAGVLVLAHFGMISEDISGCFIICLAAAVICNEAGERLPVWNRYFGGGIVAVFLGTSAAAGLGVTDEKYTAAMTGFMHNSGFMLFCILFISCGMLFGMDKSFLKRSFKNFFPAMLCAVAGAAAAGAAAAAAFGKDPMQILHGFVMPIMSCGNAGGALPLSYIANLANGEDAAEFYAGALVVVIAANIFSVVLAAVLGRLGEFFPVLTGDSEHLLRDNSDDLPGRKETKTDMEDLAGGFFLILFIYAVARAMSCFAPVNEDMQAVLALALAVVLSVFADIIKVVPENICYAARRLQHFFSTCMSLVVVAGMGFGCSLSAVREACSFTNLCIVFCIVAGAAIGAMLAGFIVGFYPIDAGIVCGLCMSNRGSYGDLTVLAACGRMKLMQYAQLASRMGGGLVLVLAALAYLL